MNIEQLIQEQIEAQVKPLKAEIGELKAELNRRLPATDAWMDLVSAAPLMNLHPNTLRTWIYSGQLQEGKEWRRKPKCKKGYQIERAFAENYRLRNAA